MDIVDMQSLSLEINELSKQMVQLNAVLNKVYYAKELTNGINDLEMLKSINVKFDDLINELEDQEMSIGIRLQTLKGEI